MKLDLSTTKVVGKKKKEVGIKTVGELGEIGS